MEMKLTNVARASLEELRLDYEDFLRQRGLEVWGSDHPALVRFKAKRCSTLEEVRHWVGEEFGRTRTDTEGEKSGNQQSVSVGGSPKQSLYVAQLVANAALSLLNLCCYFLDRQLAAQARAFEQEGGFTERLYQRRKSRRGK